MNDDRLVSCDADDTTQQRSIKSITYCQNKQNIVNKKKVSHIKYPHKIKLGKI